MFREFLILLLKYKYIPLEKNSIFLQQFFTISWGRSGVPVAIDMNFRKKILRIIREYYREE